MARSATTTDVFNAVAEPRRRQILDALTGGERPVNDLVRVLGLPQPQVSKHLRVLREVGAVEVRDQGRQRLYRLNGRALKPIHDWVRHYERSWSERFGQLDAVLQELQHQEEGDGGGDGAVRDGDGGRRRGRLPRRVPRDRPEPADRVHRGVRGNARPDGDIDWAAPDEEPMQFHNLELTGTRTFGSRVVYLRYRRA